MEYANATTLAILFVSKPKQKKSSRSMIIIIIILK